MNRRTPPLKDSISRSPLRYGLFLVALVLTCFAFAPTARAQLSPPPGGGYPNDNTAEGDDALFSLSTGRDNTAVGFNAFYNNTTGLVNTASGSQALYSNTTVTNNTARQAEALL